MNLETSIYMDNIIKKSIFDLSLSCNISACNIIKTLIKQVILMDMNLNLYGLLIEYQNSHPKRQRSIFRYRLSKDEQEMFSSARQRFKCSISNILYIGFCLFFKKLTKELCCKKQKQYNYTILKDIHSVSFITYIKKTVKKILLE